MSALAGLRVRLVLAMATVAAVSALLAGVLTAPLVGGAADEATRAPLGRQAELLARLPRAALATPRVEAVTGRTDLQVGYVDAGGERSGAAAVLSSEQVAALLDGQAVSADGALEGRSVVVEARPSLAGGAVVLATDADAVDRSARLLRRRTFLAIGLGLLAAVVAAAVLAGLLGRPLAAAAAAARRLAAGERGVPLPASSTREVADVVTALGSLDTALSVSEDRQRRFLLSVSHELRTPLTAVSGYAEALADGVVPAGETAEVGRTLQAEAARLERYIADLLALARLQADDFTLDRRPVDLAGVVAEAAAAWAQRAEAVGVEVSARTSAAPAETDPVRVRQVLDALVDNAVRVCAPGDRVVLTAAAEGDGVRLEVRDSGPGLTDDDATVAFEPGVLHERYAGSRPGGHGLGLAIVDQLVRRLGGTVSVGTAPEGGAGFAIRLPR